MPRSTGPRAPGATASLLPQTSSAEIRFQARPRPVCTLPRGVVRIYLLHDRNSPGRPRMNARLLTVAAACLTLPLLATAQGPQPLRLPSFPDLKEHATESVDITLG